MTVYKCDTYLHKRYLKYENVDTLRLFNQYLHWRTFLEWRKKSYNSGKRNWFCVYWQSYFVFRCLLIDLRQNVGSKQLVVWRLKVKCTNRGHIFKFVLGTHDNR